MSLLRHNRDIAILEKWVLLVETLDHFVKMITTSTLIHNLCWSHQTAFWLVLTRTLNPDKKSIVLSNAKCLC